MPHESTTATSRRDFLKFAGLAPVAGAAAVVGTGPADAGRKAPECEKQGYSETEHVKTFYRAARF